MAMDAETAKALIYETQAFYEVHAQRFSATREAPWKGWDALYELAEEQLRNVPPGQAFLLNDIACGNLRFVQGFAERFPGAPLGVCAVDSCPSMPLRMEGLHIVRADIATMAWEGARLADVVSRQADLTVCLAFLHHVPGHASRKRLLEGLLDITRPDGLVAVSFWRFLDDERLAQRAREATPVVAAGLGLPSGALEPGDCFLGWDGACEPARYCHYFTGEEIDFLVGALSGKAAVATRYRADGRTGAMNEYVVFKKL